MPLVLAKCPECGGTIKVESEKKLGVCENCGEPFVVEEAINNFTNYYTNNYITNNNTTHNYGDGAVVNVYENSSEDFEIVAGELKKYKGKSADVIIPNNVDKIGSMCFAHLPIKSIYVSASVTDIDDHAFSDCAASIESIQVDSQNECFVVENGVLICKTNKSIVKVISSLSNYAIPNGIDRINSYAFANCKKLKNVTISKSVTSIGNSAFSGCTNLTSVTIPKSVKTIGYSCFKNCESLLSIELPDGLTEIGISAFENCKSLKNISIPKSVETESFSHYDFEGCNLDSIKIERNYYLQCVYNYVRRLIIPSSIFFAEDRDIKSAACHKDYKLFKEIEVIYDGKIPEKALEKYEVEYLLKNNIFVGPSKKIIQEKVAQKKVQKWRSQGLCQHCGGRFVYPIFETFEKGKCKNCGRKKDY